MLEEGEDVLECGIDIVSNTSSKNPDEPVHENIRIIGNCFDDAGISAVSEADLESGPDNIPDQEELDQTCESTLNACADTVGADNSASTDEEEQAEEYAPEATHRGPGAGGPGLGDRLDLAVLGLLDDGRAAGLHDEVLLQLTDRRERLVGGVDVVVEGGDIIVVP